jgi:GAF domain-containing protein
VAGLNASTLEALLRVELGGSSLSDVLEQLVGIAKDSLVGADEVSMTLVRGDTPFTAAHTGELALDADEMQYERGYGPCIDAGTSGIVLLIDDMRHETRWPDYAAKVMPRGVLSSVSVPLPVQTEVVGALNCYSRTPSAFSDEAIALAAELAGHVGLAVRNLVAYTDTVQRAEDMAKLAADMTTAMTSRAIIEQAKGIIMAQNRCDPEAAFEVLRRASMGRNVKLRTLAADMVAGIAAGSAGPSGH